MKLKEKLVIKVKQFREELNMQQQQLAKEVGVSRQTIYYLEKNAYNPSVTISLKISKILKKPVGEIFYFEPVIRDILGSKTLDEIEKISERSGVSTEQLIKLKNIDDDELLEIFKEKELYKISEALEEDFDSLFIDD